MESKKNKALDLFLLCLVFLAVLYISLSRVDSAKVSDKMQDQDNAFSHLVRLKSQKIKELSAALEDKNNELVSVRGELAETKALLDEANNKLNASGAPVPVAAAK